MRTVLVTGASGFIGRALCSRLVACGVRAAGTVRASSTAARLPPGVKPVVTGTIDPATDWAAALSGVDTVVHLAARVHVMHDRAIDPVEAYRQANTLTTDALARQAAKRVRRLVFLSSAKVNGEGRSTPYTESDTPAPEDPYGISKWQAESNLRQTARETGLEVVIIRPPLVYGPEVKANFHQLLRMVNCGLPLPFAQVRNARSLVFVGNLVDAICTCATHPKAAGQTFFVRDGEDVSTPELIRRMATALERPAHLFSVPPPLLRLMGALTGRTVALERLLGSLSIDDALIRRELGWAPPFTMAQGLKETAVWFQQSQARKTEVSSCS
ncbi:MAG: SDR family oxidoreductase [bacterium]